MLEVVGWHVANSSFALGILWNFFFPLKIFDLRWLNLRMQNPRLQRANCAYTHLCLHVPHLPTHLPHHPVPTPEMPSRSQCVHTASCETWFVHRPVLALLLRLGSKQGSGSMRL